MNQFLGEDLSLGTIVNNMSITLGLCTFGAPDFIAFMSGYVVGLGIVIFERVYQAIPQTQFEEWIEE